MREGLIKLCLNVFMKYTQNHKKYFIHYSSTYSLSCKKICWKSQKIIFHRKSREKLLDLVYWNQISPDSDYLRD